MSEVVVNIDGVSPISWEDATRNALQNVLTDLGPNDPPPGTFTIKVNTFSAEGTNFSSFEGGIDTFKVQTTITFKQRDEPGPEPSPDCFIATAAYGTPLSLELDILRNWRDLSLKSSKFRIEFVNIYYSLSPPLARFIVRSKKMRKIVRSLLKPITDFLLRRHPDWIKYTKNH
ncbi:MAG: CFI-box-CTERM domain-containing protein [Candidatus Hodarchaeota archaeon]